MIKEYADILIKKFEGQPVEFIDVGQGDIIGSPQSCMIVYDDGQSCKDRDGVETNVELEFSMEDLVYAVENDIDVLELRKYFAYRSERTWFGAAWSLRDFIERPYIIETSEELQCLREESPQITKLENEIDGINYRIRKKFGKDVRSILEYEKEQRHRPKN